MWVAHAPVWWDAGWLAARPPVPLDGDLWERAVHSAAVILAPVWPLSERARRMDHDALMALTLILVVDRQPEFTAPEALARLAGLDAQELAGHLREQLAAREDTAPLVSLLDRLTVPDSSTAGLPADRPEQASERPGLALAAAQEVVQRALARH
jgi:hypothetical protein